MGYLIAEIVVSLLIAAGIGFALGWVCRGALAPPKASEEPEAVEKVTAAARPRVKAKATSDTKRDTKEKKAS